MGLSCTRLGPRNQEAKKRVYLTTTPYGSLSQPEEKKNVMRSSPGRSKKVQVNFLKVRSIFEGDQCYRLFPRQTKPHTQVLNALSLFLFSLLTKTNQSLKLRLNHYYTPDFAHICNSLLTDQRQSKPEGGMILVKKTKRCSSENTIRSSAYNLLCFSLLKPH